MSLGRVWIRHALVLGAIGCSTQSTTPSNPSEPDGENIPRGVDGCNCAGAAPALLGPDGVAYPFQSVVAYYYKLVQAYWTDTDDEHVLQTWLPPEIESKGEEFVTWQAKTIQILREHGMLGFADRYYRGIFGFLPEPPDTGSASGSAATCALALDDSTRRLAMLAHVGLSQAGVCGKNDNGTTKFWQVNHMSLLPIGEVYDTNELVGTGLAHTVTEAPASHCILTAASPYPIYGTGSGSASSDPIIPCKVAFGNDAVTEGVVVGVPTSEVVSGVAIGERAFTAAGSDTMPNGLSEVRTILRSDQLRAMFSVGLPRFVHESWMAPTQVRLTGHAIGPAKSPSSILTSQERSWVDGQVRIYDQACCHDECTTTYAPAPSYGSGAGSGSSAPVTVCQHVCTPEGVCQTSTASSGLVVMVSGMTMKECNGSCPEPASGAPTTAPTCPL